MAPSGPKALYPRATLKRIIRAHTKRPMGQNADVLVRCECERSQECEAC